MHVLIIDCMLDGVTHAQRKERYGEGSLNMLQFNMKTIK
jgi:hypothetical protein